MRDVRERNATCVKDKCNMRERESATCVRDNATCVRGKCNMRKGQHATCVREKCNTREGEMHAT